MSIYDNNSWMHGSLCRESRDDTAHAHKVMRRGLIILGILWALGLAAMIYVGETTLWASAETKAGLPSLEVRP